MITNKFRISYPLKDDINMIPALSGNYIFVLQKNSKLPNVGIPVKYTVFRGYKVIYVGSASNLKSRLQNHFKGNAGRSTLRKSLGCLFGYNLIPQDSHYNSNRKTKFNITNEHKLSNWIKTNLILFYYPNKRFDKIEDCLIQDLNTPLNLKKNPNDINSEFRKHLTKLRNSNKSNNYNNPIINNPRNFGKELYVKIWKDYLPIILDASKYKHKTITIDKSLFKSVGNRKNSGYSFRLDITNGIIPRKGGSAVARDLKKVLDESYDFRKFAKEKSITIRLSTNFELTMQVNDKI